MPENHRPHRTLRWIAVALMVLVLLGAATVVGSVSAAAQAGNGSTATTTPNSSQSSSPGAAVSINTSETTRNELVLTSVALPENGFIVVQNDTNVSSPAGIVNRTQYVRAGQFQNVVVRFNDSVAENATLRVAVHNDTNGNERFDFVNSSGAKDGPVTGSNGIPINDTVRLSGNTSNQSAASSETATTTQSPTPTPTATPSPTPTATPTPTPTPTPTATPTPATTIVSGTAHSQSPTETANVSAAGGAAGGGNGGSDSGASSGGSPGIAGLPLSALLVLGLLIVVAVGEMLVFARPSAFNAFPSVTAILSRSQSESQEKNEAGGSEKAVENHSDGDNRPSLTDIQHVGESRADDLHEAGYNSVEDVAASDQSPLTEINGIGGARAETIMENASALLDEPSDETMDDPPADSDESSAGILSTPFGLSDNSPTETAGTSEDSAEAQESADSTEESIEAQDSAETDEGQMGVLEAGAKVGDVLRRASGHARMLFDRRVLDPRAYGARDDWTALAFECSEEDEPLREMLEEVVYISEVPVEITEHAPDGRPGKRLADGSSVRVPREGIERIEEKAKADNPEAKRTVTLLRRALHAAEERAIRGSGG